MSTGRGSMHQTPGTMASHLPWSLTCGDAALELRGLRRRASDQGVQVDGWSQAIFRICRQSLRRERKPGSNPGVAVGNGRLGDGGAILVGHQVRREQKKRHEPR